MKEFNDTFYVEKQKNIIELKIVEQCEELKTIFHTFKFGFFKRCPYSAKWSDICSPDITIHDNRYKSLESIHNHRGVIVARLSPFSCIEVYEKTILDTIREFGKKWKYKQLVTKWSDEEPKLKSSVRRERYE